MALIQLVYISVATQQHDDRSLANMMQSASADNKKVGITGMLLYCDGFFMQVLEGEEAMVDAVFMRISQDLRHKDVMTILREPIDQRSFSGWSMGFRVLALGAVQSDPSYAPFFDGGVQTANFAERPSVAIDLLMEFGVTGPPIGVQ